jgi:hypothetical protein
MKAYLTELKHGDLLNKWKAAKRIANEGDLTLCPCGLPC